MLLVLKLASSCSSARSILFKYIHDEFNLVFVPGFACCCRCVVACCSVLVVVVAVAVVVSSVGGSAGGGRIVVGVSTGSGH